MPGERIRVQGPSGMRELDTSATARFGREADNEIVLDTPAVSRHHATLQRDDHGWVLRDAGSANGTFIGGERVTEWRIAGPTVVRFGPADGGAEVTLTPLDAPAAAPAPPPGPPTGAAGAPSGVNPNATIDIRSLGVGSGAPPLAVVANGKRREFPASHVVTIGREDANDIVVDDDLVSGRHVQVAYQAGTGWVATDTSRNGTYLEGKRLTAPHRVERRAALTLGAATGAEVELAPILSDAEAAVLDRAEGRKRRTKVLAIGAAGIIVVAAIAVGLFFGLKGSSGTKEAGATNPGTSSSGSNGLSTSALDNAKLATVQIIASSGGEDQSKWLYTGSGSIVTSNGLILTNAHVGDPEAPGLAVAYGPAPGGLGQDPKVLYVATTQKPDDAPEIKYRAKLVNADGYLDFAVLKIYADADGHKVDPSKLHLPTLKVSSVKKVHIGDHVTTIGFPDLSQNFTKFVPASVADGKVNTFVPDVYHRVDDPRYQIVTDADIKHGNSGGAAVDDEGELIAVPSAGIPGEGSDISKRLRSVDLAQPLIEAAENGKKYKSPYSSKGTGEEQFNGYRVSSSKPTSCNPGSGATDLDGSSKKFYIQVAMDGMAKGEDLVALLGQPGEVGSSQDLLNISPVGRWGSSSADGCQTLEVDTPLPAHGQLAFVVYAGTQLKQVSNEIDIEW